MKLQYLEVSDFHKKIKKLKKVILGEEFFVAKKFLFFDVLLQIIILRWWCLLHFFAYKIYII